VIVWFVALFSLCKKFSLLLILHDLHIFPGKRAHAVRTKRHAITVRKLSHIRLERLYLLVNPTVLHLHGYTIKVLQVSLIVRRHERLLANYFFLLKLGDLLLLEHKVLH